MNIQSLSKILAPARLIAAYPRQVMQHTDFHPDGDTKVVSIHGDAVIEHKSKLSSKRTYYLGTNGRVSQRKRLVGEVAATARACNTDHARFLFTEALAECGLSIPTPFIGKRS